jgi:hypothetical protein
MTDENTWAVSEWNTRLVDHYFGRRSPSDPAVKSLLVTSEELARAVGAPESRAEQVRDAFVSCIRQTMRGRLFPVGFDYYLTWDDQRRLIQGVWQKTLPEFVAHLIFACLAATESPDDFADEHSYIARLDALCASSRTDDDLRLMPALWRYLVEWLSQADDGRYRSLVLPPDNGWTRIGYTVRLAFPSRRDQQTLFEVLSQADCVVNDPPVGHVLLAVANETDRFRRYFQEVFKEFRSKYQRDSSSGAELRTHPFWASVQNAVRRSHPTGENAPELLAVQLLAEVGEQQLAPFLVASDEPRDDPALVAEELPSNIGPFRWVLASAMEGRQPSVEDAVAEALSRRRRFDGIDRLVQQGVLLFAETEVPGTFELVSDAASPRTRHALVRADLIQEFARRFSTKNTIVAAHAISGWTALLEVAVTPTEPGTLNGTSLQRVWALQRGIPITRLKAVGGIRIEGGWLGSKEVLPRIESHGDGELWLRREGFGELALDRAADGLWSLPRDDFEGTVFLSQRLDNQDVDHISVEFVAVPSLENFKPLPEPATWLRESVGQSLSLGERPAASEQGEDWEFIADPVLFLGPNVGQFVADSSLAAWVVVRSGNRHRVRRGAIRGGPANPVGQVATDQLRRRWRKLLFNSECDSRDGEALRARASIRPLAQGELPPVEASIGDSAFAAPLRVMPAANLGRLVDVAVARFNARAGISFQEWYDLLSTISGIDEPSTLRSISRAWEEAGLVDVVSRTRWRSSVVRGRPPSLALFASGGGWAATLVGLALRTTVRNLQALAKELGVDSQIRDGCSDWVPQALCFRSGNREALLQIARAARIDTTCVSMAGVEDEGRRGRARAATPPPTNYQDRHRVPVWPMAPASETDLAMFRSYRRDAPDFWEVVGSRGRYWSFNPNSARLWGAAMTGVSPVAVDGNRLVAERAFLPLPLARFLTIVSGLRSGPPPGRGARHFYALHSSTATQWFERRLTALIAPARSHQPYSSP